MARIGSNDLLFRADIFDEQRLGQFTAKKVQLIQRSTDIMVQITQKA